MPVGEPSRVGAKGTDRGNQPLAEWFLAVANHSRELGQLPQLEWREIGLDDALVTGGLLPRGPTPDFSMTSRSPMFFEAMTALS